MCLIFYVAKKYTWLGIPRDPNDSQAKGTTMKSITVEPQTATPKPSSKNNPPTTTPSDSAALRRLMDEVRFDEGNGSSPAMAYDRAHNRHNR